MATATIQKRIPAQTAEKVWKASQTDALRVIRVAGNHWRIRDRKTNQTLIDNLESREEAYIVLGMAGSIAQEQGMMKLIEGWPMHPDAVLPQ